MSGAASVILGVLHVSWESSLDIPDMKEQKSGAIVHSICSS